MGVFENLPYTNFHELNLDWIIKMFREYADSLEYLKRFDITQEVSDKLEQMLADGELTDLLGTLPARVENLENGVLSLREITTGLNAMLHPVHDYLYADADVDSQASDLTLIGSQTITRDGWYLITADFEASEAHSGYVFGGFIDVWRNGERLRHRGVRGQSLHAGGGFVNVLLQLCATGDVIRYHATQTYPDNAVNIAVRADLMRWPG